MRAEAQINDICSTRPLLFINKDATNLTRTPVEAYAIGSHVSKAHRNWSRSARIRRTKLSVLHRTYGTEYLEGSDSNDSYSPRKHEYRISQREPYHRYDGNASTSTSSTTSTTSYANGSESDLNESTSVDGCLPVGKRTLSKTETTSSVPPGNGGPLITKRTSSLVPIRCKDPFSTTARIRPADRDALSLAREFHVFAAWPARASRVFRERLYGIYDSYLAAATEDEALYNGLLAAGLMVKSLGSIKDRHGVIREANFHKAQAMRILNHQLALKGSGTNVLPIIRLLLSLEFVAGNYESSTKYIAAALCLFIAGENPRTTGVEIFFISDVWISVTLMRHTDFSVSSWDPGPWREQASATNPQHVYCSGGSPRRPLSSTSCLPDEILRSTMKDVHELVEIMAFLECCKDSPAMRCAIVCWLHNRSNAILGRLVNRFVDITYSSCLSTEPGPKDPNSLLNVTLSLAMILFTGTLFSDTPFPVATERILATFGTKLRTLWTRALKGTAVVEDSLLLWLLFLCTYCNAASDTAKDLVFQDWATGALDFWCQELHIVEYEVLRSRLTRFLYLDRMDSYLFGVMASFDRYQRDLELEISLLEET